jgi:ribosomal protein S27E
MQLVSSPLDRQAACPSCGATITFKFAGARAVVCEYCNFAIARTDRGLHSMGRMGELLEIPTPLQVGVTGTWGEEQFEVEGRIQMDRAGAPGAPWQEILVGFPMSGRSTWVAYAQGRWYATNDAELPPGGVPAISALGPGSNVDLGPHGHWVVAEVGQRRVLSGEGAMTTVPMPGVVTRYADISAQGGGFGTIDYGDGTEQPELYLGRQFDPRSLQLDSGLPLEAPEGKAAAVDCPNCGGNLPLLSQTAERIVCQYCGTASDVREGNLAALGPSPRPPIQPYVPIGAEGEVRGNRYTVCGFVIRSCMVEGMVYSWREYLLFGGDHVGYRWLMEEDGKWTFAEPVEAGEVMDSGNSAMLGGQSYSFKQQVQAKVDYVIGEFYWKIEIGERVDATEFQGSGGKLSRERTATEVNYSFVTPLAPHELQAFGVAPPAGAGIVGAGFGGGDSEGGSSCSSILGTIVTIIFIVIWLVMEADGCGGFVGGGYSGGGWSK